MRFVFAYAGIPDEIFDVLQRERTFIAGSNTEFHPVRHGPYGAPYTAPELKRLVALFASYVAKEQEADVGESGFAVFYVRYGESDALLERALFPFVLTVPIEWHLDFHSGATVRQSKNNLARLFSQAAPGARKGLEALRTELVEKGQRTPWLLPVRNFRSGYLEPALRDLQSELPTARDAHHEISTRADRFRALHPPQKVQEKHKSDRRYFVDDSGMTFKPPGHDLHGFHRPTEGHTEACAVSSRRRLGAPYRRAFHYDCTKKEGGATKALLHSCHSVERAIVDSEKHINIATNDFTRPEAKRA